MTFSKPLGGPTLADIFSPEAGRDVEALYIRDSGVSEAVSQPARGTILGQSAWTVRRLFNLGTAYERGVVHPSDRARKEKGEGERLWVDAEEFLDTLETAAVRVLKGERSFTQSRLELLAKRFDPGVPQASAIELRNTARRLLAVECSKFLLCADVESELWEPFRRWRDVLRQPKSADKHTIITFNYDRVLETLGFGDWVLLPGLGATLADHVLKLHGSVDWKRVGKSGAPADPAPADPAVAEATASVTFERHEDQHFAATCTDDELAIAPPGPAKALMTLEIEPLWKIAEQRLAEANAVCFIGYRFPPTDSTARRRILKAIPSGFASLVHVVLGPDVNHPDARRLAGLLTASGVDQLRVKVHPLFGQDFLSVFEPSWLTSP